MDAQQLYQEAYKLHYKSNKLEAAVGLYKEVISKYPSSSEAGYSKTQLSNISKLGVNIESQSVIDIGKKSLEEVREDEAISNLDSDSVLVSTTSEIVGYRLTKHIGIVSAQIVLGTGMFSELSASWSDLTGTRSDAFESKFQRVHQSALRQLKSQAIKKRGNGVVGAKFDFSMLGQNMVNVVATGTAVRVESEQ